MDTRVPTKDEVEALILGAFADVRREGGVSWSETSALDANESEELLAIARAKDRDTRWQELVDDDKWPGSHEGFPYLDDVSFAYYLPAAMVRWLRTGYDVAFLPYHLVLEAELTPPMRDHILEQWGGLNNAQCQVIATFFRYMMHVEETPSREWWLAAYNSHWYRYGPDPLK